MDFVTRNTHSNTDSNIQTNINNGPVTTAHNIPYVGGTSETIALTQQPYNIGVARKPITTLRRLLTNRDLTKPRRRRQRERQKNNRFNEQKNNSARASRFFVHSFAFTAQLRREMTKLERILLSSAPAKIPFF